MKTMWLTILSLLLLPLAVVAADDAELYDPAPPADSAFVRVVNAKADADVVKVSVGGVAYADLAYADVSGYRIVKGGTRAATIGAASKEVAIEAGSYATLVLNAAGDIIMIEDELLANPAKARVYFYNLSDAASASLFAPEHGAAIVDGVASNAGNSREVNALKLTLQVKAGDVDVKDFPDVQLKRRAGSSFFLFGKAGSYQAAMIENSVLR